MNFILPLLLTAMAGCLVMSGHERVENSTDFAMLTHDCAFSAAADSTTAIPSAADPQPCADYAYTDTSRDTRKPFYMSVRTNMLYDALLLPDLGVEFYLGHNWSIKGNWMYGWWDKSGSHRYWRAYGGDLTLRRWFGSAAARKPLTGHHAGIYAQLLTYDFEFGGKGEMAGEPGEPLWARPSYAFGLEYGYSLPVARRLNIDFAIGIGYLGGYYYKYHPEGKMYVADSLHRRNWFGPTKLEVTLVWQIGHGNCNSGKGGDR